jgi:hypothetical protein
MFNSHGSPTLILDGDCIRNRSGQVVAWIKDENVHSLGGVHLGWFAGEVIYDKHNRALLFTEDHTGHIPFSPGLSGTPGMPGFSGRPGKPGYCGAPGRPGNAGWSDANAGTYFDV